jgi:hypothetical protein
MYPFGWDAISSRVLFLNDFFDSLIENVTGVNLAAWAMVNTGPGFDSMLDQARDWHFLLFVWLVEWIDSRHLSLFIDALNVDRYAVVRYIRHHR